MSNSDFDTGDSEEEEIAKPEPFKEEEEFHEPLEMACNFVTLISKEGRRFHLDEETASVSQLLKSLLSSSFSEAKSREVKLPNIRAEVLEKVCDYMHWFRLEKSYTDADTNFPIPNDILMEVLVASDFLRL